jgi:4-carboxymuconolactone decarboxylase
MDETERYNTGLTTRRSVLGDAHVDRSLATKTEFTDEFQALITRYAWGEIWTRPGLDHTTRRLLVLGMTIALNRGEEFKLHVRAALTHGISPDLIKTAFHQAQEVMKELEAAAP